MNLKPFAYLRLSVEFRGLEKPVYTYFPGSFIRGTFGFFLRKAVCPFRLKQPCESCLVQQKCFYWEICGLEKQEELTGKNIDNPFVLDIEEQGRKKGERNSDLSFAIVLFGPALKHVEFIILVFLLMGREGIGKERMKCREIVIRDGQGKLVYSSLEQKQVALPQPWFYEFGKQKGNQCIRVKYLSPVQLDQERKWVYPPKFETLVYEGLQRIIYLQEIYGSREPISTREIVKSSQNVHSVWEYVKVVKRLKYSEQKKEKVDWGGIVGIQVFYGSILPVHMDILRFVSIFHLGRNSSFGSGQFRVEVPTDSGKRFVSAGFTGIGSKKSIEENIGET